ncbi:hypothetical protein NO2_0006 [Candidatus Termititenax persephonae]|uniref:Tetratricopeptide repeat protein n=1 Tax=Candidatus Termititenax persephonae TaxID=2218525 RepID=A0A388TGH7_9BACT|nr:hypothetical protein NO2_0006 [Candidatus Termititenax persephonae]
MRVFYCQLSLSKINSQLVAWQGQVSPKTKTIAGPPGKANEQTDALPPNIVQEAQPIAIDYQPVPTADLFRKRAEAFIQLRNYAAASQDLQRALALDAKTLAPYSMAKTYKLLAAIAQRQGQDAEFKQLAACTEEALDVGLPFQRALTNLKSGDYAQAETEFQQLQDILYRHYDRLLPRRYVIEDLGFERNEFAKQGDSQAADLLNAWQAKLAQAQ